MSKHLYMWSFQTGTPNPDGVIRLPGRMLNFAAFALFGNIGVSYFYLLLSLIITFVAFLCFIRYFLDIQQRRTQLIGALFFAINPIFLGNLAKIGLILAVAMLPLCLVAIKVTFEKHQLRYLLLYIACLNVSLIHPYTFAVNLVVSGGYLLYQLWLHPQFFAKNLGKFVGMGVLAIFLHAYFILPMASLGTLSKDAISDAAIAVPTNYTSLVDVSMGDALTGLSLSKSVFLDFNFYNDAYRAFYFMGAFGFYIILIGVYLFVEKRLSRQEKQRVVIALSAFLLLVSLTTMTIFSLNEIIKLLIGLPGGWAFRSPLKWQLYIPLTLFSVLAIVLSRLSGTLRVRLIGVGLALCLLAMNSFLFGDIIQKLLTPRTLDNFAVLDDKVDLNNKTLLFVSSNDCLDFMRNNPEIKTELNQVFLSKNAQVKNTSADNLTGINFGNYDYILGCKSQRAFGDKLTHQYKFGLAQTFVSNNFKLYANQRTSGPVYALGTVFSLNLTQPIDSKYDFTNDVLKAPFTFIAPSSKENDKVSVPTTGLSDIFETLHPEDLQDGHVTIKTTAQHAGSQTLYVRPTDQPLFYQIDSQIISLSHKEFSGSQPVSSSQSGITLPGNDQFTITYIDPQFKPANLIQNPSLENGLWQKNVRDCYAYNDKPAIAMKLNKQRKSNGTQSLQLETKSHIACSGPRDIPVKAGESYLLSFDYQSLDKKYAGYNITFDDSPQTSVDERLSESSDSWHSFYRQVTVPAGAHTLKLMLYAYPDSDGKLAITRYDNFSLINTPLLKDTFYLVSSNPAATQTPGSISTTIINPTKKVVHVTKATKPFYLGTNETYHSMWQLVMSHPDTPFNLIKPPPSVGTHIELNNSTNGWYVDPEILCKEASHCIKNLDGSYDFDITMQFAPQRWFYIGAIVSLATLVLIALYFVYDHKWHKEYKVSWKGFQPR